MKKFEENMSNWLEERIEAYVDGELSPAERSRFEQLASGNDAVRDQVLLARQVKQSLEAMPQPVCPPEITVAVLRQVRRDAAERRPSRRPSRIRRRAAARLVALERISLGIREMWPVLLRPSLAMSALAGIVIAGALLGRSPSTIEPSMSAEEVQQALEEAKWTFAYVTRVSLRAGETVRKDVLEDRVAEPMQQAVATALQKAGLQ